MVPTSLFLLKVLRLCCCCLTIWAFPDRVEGVWRLLSKVPSHSHFIPLPYRFSKSNWGQRKRGKKTEALPYHRDMERVLGREVGYEN